MKPLTLTILATALLVCSVADATNLDPNKEKAVSATCRVSWDSGIGTGVVYQIDDTNVKVATCKHVVTDDKRRKVAKVMTCEFFIGSQFQKRLTGTVNLEGSADIATITIPKRQFLGILPAAIPVARAAPQRGDIVFSVGCPFGANPSPIQAKVIGYDVDTKNLRFSTPPEEGRSGSAIFNKDCTEVVAILFARDGGYRTGEGLGQSLAQIATTRLPESIKETQCGPDGCPGGNSQRSFGIINRNQQQSQTTPTLPGFPAASTPTTFEDEIARKAIDGVTVRVNEIDERVVNLETSVTSMAQDMGDAGILKQEIADLGVVTRGLKDRVGVAEGVAAAAEGKVKEVEKTLWGKTKTWLYSIIAVFTGGGLLTWLMVLVITSVGWWVIRKQGMKVAQVVDKITDMIPGDLDDKLIDGRVYGALSKFTGQPIPTWAMQPGMTPWGAPAPGVWGNAPVQSQQPMPQQPMPQQPMPQPAQYVQPQVVQPTVTQ